MKIHRYTWHTMVVLIALGITLSTIPLQKDNRSQENNRSHMPSKKTVAKVAIAVVAATGIIAYSQRAPLIAWYSRNWQNKITPLKKDTDDTAEENASANAEKSDSDIAEPVLEPQPESLPIDKAKEEEAPEDIDALSSEEKDLFNKEFIEEQRAAIQAGIPSEAQANAGILIQAIQAKNIPKITFLLQEKKINPNAPTKGGIRPLGFVAMLLKSCPVQNSQNLETYNDIMELLTNYGAESSKGWMNSSHSHGIRTFCSMRLKQKLRPDVRELLGVGNPIVLVKREKPEKTV